jgi:hypothetical protein|tara:strand:+ start:283 stop:702 length:420 start_codon:yes stop_codon:yes gene_type:complete
MGFYRLTFGFGWLAPLLGEAAPLETGLSYRGDRGAPKTPQKGDELRSDSYEHEQIADPAFMELLEFLFAAFIIATLPKDDDETERAVTETIIQPAMALQHIDVSKPQQAPTEKSLETHLIDDSPHVKKAGMWIKEAFTF